MMYPSNFRKYLLFCMHSNRSTNKMVANDGQVKLIIQDVNMIFQCEYWKFNKNFLCGRLKVRPVVSEKHIINAFGLNTV